MVLAKDTHKVHWGCWEMQGYLEKGTQKKPEFRWSEKSIGGGGGASLGDLTDP